MNDNFPELADELVQKILVAVESAPNEFALHQAIEGHLEEACRRLDITWNSFSVNVFLRSQGDGSPKGFADAVHGATVIEYKRPRAFRGRAGRILEKAQEQAEGYARWLHVEEGRPVDEYVLIAWDGAHISFGKIANGDAQWENLTSFDSNTAVRLLTVLRDNGRSLVNAAILFNLVGPYSRSGNTLIPTLYDALVEATAPDAPTSRTKLLFTEWGRLFSQVVGNKRANRRRLTRNQAAFQHIRSEETIPQYIFALGTHMAMVAKLVAALSIPHPTTDISDANVNLKERFQTLENGDLFRDAGVTNMLSGDFFSWYLDDTLWAKAEESIGLLLTELQALNFDTTRKETASIRDLFKGIYQNFMPREIRHAMGEFYTPDWLAAHALNEMGWRPENQLLDPTCGTGTFLLEAIKRRLSQAREQGQTDPTAQELLDGIYGMDLNPLAVLAARASAVVFLAQYLDPSAPLAIPIWLADAINSPQSTGASFEHQIMTQQGTKTFRVPSKLVHSPNFHQVFDRIRELVSADTSAKDVCEAVRAQFGLDDFTECEDRLLDEVVSLLVSLHEQQWDGIWCPILSDQFTAGAMPRVSHIAGNPPWVKWSNLPREYSDFIKDRCRRNGVFSNDTMYGGIESDISTVITFEVISKWLEPTGSLAFFITGEVFQNESSQGFRRLRYQGGNQAAFRAVQDFNLIAPFSGVSNHPVLMLAQNGSATNYPVSYRIWKRPDGDQRRRSTFTDPEEFTRWAESEDLLASPVYGTDSGPWLKGMPHQHDQWQFMFNSDSKPAYMARKGVCTDRNGIFFVRVLGTPDSPLCRISNNPALGKITEIPQVTRAIVEHEHVFPLLRGEGVRSFSAKPDPEYSILVPQREMHGDPDLLKNYPRTHSYLNRFRSHLASRSSYNRFQKGKPFWSVWNVGAYTFAPYKVVWKEMSGNRFEAAYISTAKNHILGDKVIIPDHKVYFVPMCNEEEAAYLTGLLNAPSVATGITSYSPRLSLGTNVVEYLAIPPFDPNNLDHFILAARSKYITNRADGPSEIELSWLDEMAGRVFRNAPSGWNSKRPRTTKQVPQK